MGVNLLNIAFDLCFNVDVNFKYNFIGYLLCNCTCHSTGTIFFVCLFFHDCHVCEIACGGLRQALKYSYTSIVIIMTLMGVILHSRKCQLQIY